MEKESKIAVTTEAGETIENYPTIGEHDLYKVDIDKSDGQSILEVVTKHFNEHEGTQKEAENKIKQRLGEAWAFLTSAKTVKEVALLDTVANGHALTLKDAYKGLVIKPGGKIQGPVHFTVGFSLEAIPELHNALKGEVTGKPTPPTPLTQKAVDRVGQARAVGQFAFDHKLVKSMADVDRIRIAAFMELLYTQISALLDGTKDDKTTGLTKNRTLALSRVSMGVIRRSLPDEAQAVVKNPEFYEAVLRVMQKTYSGIEGQWGEHKRDKELFVALAQGMLKAAFNVDKVEDNSPAAEQGGFGKMTEVTGAEDVGDPKAPGKGFALELRKVTVGKNWDLTSVMEAAFRVIGLSRGLHKTPDS
jgi:hypothetical protein